MALFSRERKKVANDFFTSEGADAIVASRPSPGVSNWTKSATTTGGATCTAAITRQSVILYA
jgi:hypothetical protein